MTQSNVQSAPATSTTTKKTGKHVHASATAKATTTKKDTSKDTSKVELEKAQGRQKEAQMRFEQAKKDAEAAYRAEVVTIWADYRSHTEGK